jgi:hypothetical protein
MRHKTDILAPNVQQTANRHLRLLDPTREA